MELKQHNSSYNPYFVKVNHYEYEVKKIHFFDARGIVLSTSCGWFEHEGFPRHVGNIVIDGDVTRKIKPDFLLTHPFIIPVEDKWLPKGKYCEVYLPYYPSEWIARPHDVDYETKIMHYKRYVYLNDGFFIDVYDEMTIKRPQFDFRSRVESLYAFLKESYDYNEDRGDIIALCKAIIE